MDEQINSQLPKATLKSVTQVLLSPVPRADLTKQKLYLSNLRHTNSNANLASVQKQMDLASQQKGMDQQPQTSRGPATQMINLSGQNQQVYCFQNQSLSPSASPKTDELIGEDADQITVESDQPANKIDLNQPLPMVQSGYDLEADMMFGWRPDEDALPGAPIPLHYNFGRCEIPINPYTNQIPDPLYLGARIPTSYQVHKMFANRPESTGCDSLLNKDPYPSYKTVIPKKIPYTIKNKEPLRKFIGMDPKINLNCELKFDSFFECGNLDMVTKVKPLEYDLYMRVDTNTTGHHQWFYYSIQYSGRMFKKQKVTFNICNFTKPASLYSFGMRVCIAKKSQKFLWHKGGDEISYSKGRVIRINHSDPARIRYYYNLRFTITLEKEEDKIYFAYCYPYSFSKLTSFLQSLNIECKTRDLLKEGMLCKDLSGVQVPLLTITSRIQSDPNQYNLIKMSEFSDENDLISLPLYKKKKFCIVGARVHPGETPASWMMQGFLKYLTGNSLQAEQLRKRVVFKIVPMSNPDGVISGNYRTSMAGCDLNRRYDDPDFRFHPTVWSIKNMAENILTGDPVKGFGPFATPDDIVAFIDMHGHSRKKNVFIYGPPVPLHSDKYYKVRVIPKLLSEETEMFRYHSCRFLNEKSKRTAARIVLNKELGIFNCFTFEASFHSYYDHERVNHEFTPAMYEAMGANLVNSLYEYMMVVEEDDRCKQAKMVEKQKKQKKAESHQEMLRLQIQEAMQTQPSHFSKLAPNALQPPSSANKNSFVKKQLKHKSKLGDSKHSASTSSFARLNSASVPQSSAKILNPNEPTFDEATLSPKRELPLKSQIFRNLLEICGELQNFQQQHDSSDEEPGTSGDEHYQVNYKETHFAADNVKANENSDEDEDTGELNPNQMKGLQNEILDAIKEFTKVSKISKKDYYGEIAKQAEKKQLYKAMRDKQLQQQHQVNYQSQTVSIGIKRRSFINFTDLYTESPVQKPILKPKAKPEIKALQQSGEKLPMHKTQNLSSLLLHPINLYIDKQTIQTRNITNPILATNSCPSQNKQSASQFTFIEKKRIGVPISQPQTYANNSQAPSPQLVQQLNNQIANLSANNSVLKKPLELRTQWDQPTQALNKYVNVNQWPFVGTPQAIQSQSTYTQELQDLKQKKKLIFIPKLSTEVQSKKLGELANEVTPQSSSSKVNFLNIQSPFQQVVAKSLTNFAFDEALNLKNVKKPSGTQAQKVRREKNKIARISEENSKQSSLIALDRFPQVLLDNYPSTTTNARQDKPTTILFGSSEKNTVESKQRMVKYENQAVRSMMTRKVKLINKKVEESTQDPKETFLFKNNVDLIQKQQMIQQQQLSYRNSCQDDNSNFLANRSLRQCFKTPNQPGSTPPYNFVKNHIQQLERLASDFSITSFVAEQARLAIPARSEQNATQSTLEEGKSPNVLKKSQDQLGVLKTVKRPMHPEVELRDIRSPKELQVVQQQVSFEKFVQVQIASLPAFQSQQKMIREEPQKKIKQTKFRIVQKAIQETQMQQNINNSQFQNNLNRK